MLLTWSRVVNETAVRGLTVVTSTRHIENMPDQPRAYEALAGDVPLGGVYANTVEIWHTSHEFTVEFLAGLPPGASGEARAVYVARLKIPPELAWKLTKILIQHIDRFERANPHRPIAPPPTD